MTRGLYVSPTEFRSFAEKTEPLSGQIATRLSAGDMSSWFGLLPNPDPVLKAMGKQIDVYRNLMAEPSVSGAYDRRAGAVLAMERGLDLEKCKSTPTRVVKSVDKMLATLDQQRIINDQLFGAFFGHRISEVMWGLLDGSPAPVDLVAKPWEWFGFDPEGSALKFRPRLSTTGVDVPERKFVVVGRRRNWENPYGDAALAPCFWPVTFKRGGFKFWMTFTEKYGMPWAVGKLPRQAGLQEHNDLADKLAAMVRDAVATIPDDASVELMTLSGSHNSDMYQNFLMFCRSEIAITLLGNNQSVEMQSNKASAVAGQVVEKFIRDGDAQMIAAGFNDLVRYFCEVNFPGVVPPVFAFWEQEAVDDKQATRDEKLQRAGARFTNQYLQRAYKLEDGDLAPEAPATPENTQINVPGDGAASFADLAEDAPPADQVALDAAIDQLPADALQAAMKKMLMPALKAIESASSPEEVRQALLDAWPEMDATDLENLMAQAYFVSDLVGQDSAAVVGSA